MYCPNRECPDFRLTGEHQEFTSGATNCSTCGAALVEGPVPEAPTDVVRAERPAPSYSGVAPALIESPEELCRSCGRPLPGDSEICPRCANAAAAEAAGLIPWRRFWAKQIDIAVFGLTGAPALALIAGALIGGLPVDEEAQPLLANVVVFLLVTVSWLVLETIFLTMWGTTPGRWLLSIRIQQEQGGKPKLRAAVSRTVSLWAFGLGLNIPLLNLVCSYLSYRHYTTELTTPWDRESGLCVVHSEFRPVRVGIAIAVLLAICWIALYS